MPRRRHAAARGRHQGEEVKLVEDIDCGIEGYSAMQLESQFVRKA